MVNLKDPYILLCLAGIFGFPLLAAMMEFVSPGNASVSIIFRGFVLVLSILVIWGGSRFRKSVNLNIDVALFLAFWIVYFVRILNDTVLQDILLGRPRWFYWVWAFGVCFAPAFALILPRQWVKFDALGVVLLYAGAICSVLILAKGNFDFVTSSGDVVDGGRLNVSALNPIFVGHAGASTCLLGAWMFLKAYLRGSNWMSKGVAVLAIVAGAIVLVKADSRGPLAALLVVSLFCIASLRTSKLIVASLFAISAGIVLMQMGVIDSQLLDSLGLSRVSASFSDELDISARQRQVSAHSAYNQFLESPIVGDALEERTTLFYPHNVVIESLMATGILGGIPFILLLFRISFQCWRLLRAGDSNAWACLIFLQYLIGAQFSGSLYTSYTMWASLSMVSLLFQQRWYPYRYVRPLLVPRSTHPLGNR
ncbi:O-antigen ligase family protein [Mesorhizobium sp. M1329]|uniref:O-antigen ligase family protein n=1 Tax=Mesorhizobium sp. M1329 TaxID=2957083 RepID=UPI00333D9145